MSNRPRVNFDPYPEQEEVLHSRARFRVVAAGRRSGKTMMAGAETADRAKVNGEGWLGWWLANSDQTAQTGFQLIDEALPASWVARRKRSAPRMHELVNGAKIEYKTADGDPNVSVGLDWLVVDEADKNIPERIITQELRPTLSDTNGDALFISTPHRKDWFHKWWHRGNDPDYPDVESFRWSTYENPHVPDDEIDAAREDMPERIWRQEYLAEFLDDTGGVFDAERAALAYTVDGVDPHPMAVGPYRMAADLARAEDYLAIVTLDRYGNVAHLTRARGLSWRQVSDRITAVAAAHGDPPVAIDATRDNKLVADLERDGLNIHPVHFSAQRKQTLVENLAAAIENGEIRVPADSILHSELSVFEYSMTKAGNIRYDAPAGSHDDTVDALAMAYDLSRMHRETPTGTIDFGGDTSGSGSGDEGFAASELGQAVAEFRRENNRW